MRQDLHPACFFDRDGVLLAEVRGAAAKHPAEMELLPGVVETLLTLRERGYLLILVSNQPDFALGNIDFDTREALEYRFIQLLADQNVELDGIYYCYHHEEAKESSLRVHCKCRKPGSGLLIEAQEKFSIDLARSYLVGDRASDIRAAVDAAVHSILLDPEDRQAQHLRIHGVAPENTVSTLTQILPLIPGVQA